MGTVGSAPVGGGNATQPGGSVGTSCILFLRMRVKPAVVGLLQATPAMMTLATTRVGRKTRTATRAAMFQSTGGSLGVSGEAEEPNKALKKTKVLAEGSNPTPKEPHNLFTHFPMTLSVQYAEWPKCVRLSVAGILSQSVMHFLRKQAKDTIDAYLCTGINAPVPSHV